MPTRLAKAADAQHLSNLQTVLNEGASDRRLHPSRRLDFEATRDAIVHRQQQIRVWTPPKLTGLDLDPINVIQVREVTVIESMMLLQATFRQIQRMPGWNPEEIAVWRARGDRMHAAGAKHFVAPRPDALAA